MEGSMFPDYMTPLHRFVAVSSAIIAVAILVGILLGWNVPMNNVLGINKSLRDVLVPFWAFIVPAFFVAEEAVFAPKADTHTPAQLNAFLKGQQTARIVWLVIGGSVGVLIGMQQPELPGTQIPNASTSQPQTSGG
jgi:hypothetical protein